MSGTPDTSIRLPGNVTGRFHRITRSIPSGSRASSRGIAGRPRKHVRALDVGTASGGYSGVDVDENVRRVGVYRRYAYQLGVRPIGPTTFINDLSVKVCSSENRMNDRWFGSPVGGEFIIYAAKGTLNML